MYEIGILSCEYLNSLFKTLEDNIIIITYLITRKSSAYKVDILFCTSTRVIIFKETVGFQSPSVIINNNIYFISIFYF